MQDLYTDKGIRVMNMLKSLNKYRGKDSTFMNRRLNNVKMLFLFKSINRFNTTPRKIQRGFFFLKEIDHLIFKFV